MKVKLDENLPESLVASLAALNHDLDTVHSEGLSGRADPEVWQAAQSSGRFLVTQDLDFSDMRKFAPGTHHGLLLVRLRSPGRRALMKRVLDIFRSENVNAWVNCFVLATETKIRVHRPKL
jgi:predicted nuclease of predicted toxin-antitoxin system